MDVALYERVSGDIQKKEETIETQDYWLRRWCEQNGHRVVGVYRDEGLPSEIPVGDRPDGRRLLEEAASGRFEAVVVYKAGRWSRYSDIYYEGRKRLLRLRIDLISIKEDLTWKRGDDGLASGGVLLANEFERDNINDNCLDGRYRRAAEGGYVGGVVNYGYRISMASV